MDKCDESVMSQTTISISVAFDRIWMLAASMKHATEWKDFICISRSCCHTKVGQWYALSVAPIADRFWPSLPEWSEFCSLSARCIDATASSCCVNFLARCSTRYEQRVPDVITHNIIFIQIDVKRCFYFNWSAYY